MYPVYKQVKIPMPHCPDCDEMLKGNNSNFSPWECSCGVWGSSYDKGDFSKLEYFIKVDNPK